MLTDHQATRLKKGRAEMSEYKRRLFDKVNANRLALGLKKIRTGGHETIPYLKYCATVTHKDGFMSMNAWYRKGRPAKYEGPSQLNVLMPKTGYLYLFHDNNGLKIGFSETLDAAERLLHHERSNPGIKVDAVWRGTRDEETDIKRTLTPHRLTKKSTEWFRHEREVWDFFLTLIKTKEIIAYD